MMNPAEFSLPDVTYFNMGTPEDSTFQAVTQGPNPDNSVHTQSVNVLIAAPDAGNNQFAMQNEPILNATQIEDVSKTGPTADAGRENEETLS